MTGETTSDIRPQFHSTNMHDTNRVNFWTLYSFDHQFAPRYHKKSATWSRASTEPLSKLGDQALALGRLGQLLGRCFQGTPF
jgi:hypothetical protein